MYINLKQSICIAHNTFHITDQIYALEFYRKPPKLLFVIQYSVLQLLPFDNRSTSTHPIHTATEVVHNVDNSRKQILLASGVTDKKPDQSASQQSHKKHRTVSNGLNVT